MNNQRHIQKVFLFFMGIFLFTQAFAFDSFANVRLVENWSKYKKFGQISGVSVDTFGNVFVFHRGDRTWGPNTFTMDNKFKDPNQGPIKQSTIIVLHPETGELITQTGANM